MSLPIPPIVCPLCESGDLRSPGPAGHPCCERCGYCPSVAVLLILRWIHALPDALGTHACECGHPEMRRLPDGVFRCPACAAEVIPPESGDKTPASPS